MGAPDFANLPHIGESLRRKEDYRFLTGAGNYTDDINLANQTHCIFVRSPHAYGKDYYWLTGEFVNHDKGEDTDEWALAHGYVSVVPVQFDLTAHFAIQELNSWSL